jgi:phage N-6-adenine-methyltransferase
MVARLNAGHFQAWRTPRIIFDKLSDEVGGYCADLFADPENALHERYFTAEQDAIMQPWVFPGGVAFGNPPYGGDFQEEALTKAITEVRVTERLAGVDLLVQASVSTKWFLRAVQECEVHLFHGRIAFDVPPGMPNPKRPSFSNALVRVRRGGPVGVTAMRSARTGAIIQR